MSFQTSDQFLVIANKKYLGDPACGTFMPPSSNDVYDRNCFYNAINIGKWNFRAETGEKNKYGDYHSVMIVKGVKGTDLRRSTRRPERSAMTVWC